MTHDHAANQGCHELPASAWPHAVRFLRARPTGTDTGAVLGHSIAHGSWPPGSVVGTVAARLLRACHPHTAHCALNLGALVCNDDTSKPPRWSPSGLRDTC